MSATSVVIDVLIEDKGWGKAARWEDLADRAVDIALSLVPEAVMAGSELSLVLASDAEIRALNRDHRGQDKATNVLSFPQHEPDEPVFGPLLGDIIIARETVEREAAEAGIAFDDHAAHMVVHGLLHLLGYDHLDETGAEEMEALEREILAGLGIKDPYAGTAPA